jgi:hypothetical protein
MWRKHLIICAIFGVLAVPIYYLDRALNSGGGSNWIALDFRGLIIWTYVSLVTLHIALSSIALLIFPKLGVFRTHAVSIVLAAILLFSSFYVYGSLRRQAVSNEYQALIKSRRALVNVIELKQWWYVPDHSSPKEIRANVVVHQSGRFAGNITGEQTIDQLGSTRTVFESTNEPASQRQVSNGDAFTYAFPLKTVEPVRADKVTISLYLFKNPGGHSTDITKVFMTSLPDPQRDDDGQSFYGLLPPPSPSAIGR